MITIKRIEIGSAFRIGMLVTGLFSLIVFALVGIFQAAIFSSLFSMSSDFSGGAPLPESSFFGLAGLAGFCTLLVCGTIIYAIIGGISAALFAFFYNLVARQWGGLEVELAGLEAYAAADMREKAKNRFFDEDFES